MSKVSLKTRLNASADAVWEVIRDFNGLGKFMESIARSTMDGSGVGATRTLTFVGGSIIVERLESLEDAKHTLSYAIIQGDLPLEGYLSTMALRDLGQGKCELAWSSTFEPKGAPEADVVKMIEGVYREGFAGLKRLFAR